jgi:hypothetical protein
MLIDSMARDPSYSPFSGPAHMQPSIAAEILWTLYRDGETRTAKLRQQEGGGGSDLQLFANGGFFVSRRFPDPALALEEATRWRRKYEAEGWRSSSQA